MRWIALAASAALLSGCALPPAVAIASYALDAGSFVVSGKTLTDHGLSLMMQEDCALIRVLEGEICKEEEFYEQALAVLTPLEAEESDPVLLAEGEDAEMSRLLFPEGYLADGARPVGYSEESTVLDNLSYKSDLPGIDMSDFGG